MNNYKWSEAERKYVIQALNRIADNLGRLANDDKVVATWQRKKFVVNGERVEAWFCSECNHSLSAFTLTNYCPNCGSRMEEGDADDN